MIWLTTALLFGAEATAGSGPWVVGEQRASLYTGVEVQRLTELAVSTGSFAVDDVLPVASGITTFGAQGIISWGLLPRVELEGQVPWYRVFFNRPDDPLCDALGLNACRPTEGLGVLRGRMKVLVLDELYGPPLSLAVGGELRAGTFTAPERAQLTNLGEGTTDLGAFLSAGRSGGLGAEGSWSLYTDVGWRRRLSNTELPTYDGRTAVDDTGAEALVALDEQLKAPGDEFYGEVQVFLGPSLTWSVGPNVVWLVRPQGVDFEDVLAYYLPDKDRLSALAIETYQAGAKALIRAGDRVTFSGGVLRTVFAANNPADLMTVSVGLTFQDIARERRADEG